MKIKQIKIENFKCIDSMSYEPKQKTTVLCAKNGTGKTAFKEAFYGGITGNFPADSIKIGESSASVEMMLEGGLSFERILNASKGNKVKVNGKTTTAKALAETIEDHTGIALDTLKVVASSNIVEGLSSAEFGDFITKYLPEELDADILLKHVGSCSTEARDEILSTFPATPTKFGIEDVKEVYKLFFDNRAVCKKNLATAKAKLGTLEPKKPTRTLKEIEDDLAIIIGKEASYKTQKELIDLYEKTVKMKAKAEENIKNLESEIAAISVSKPNPSLLKELNEKKAKIEEKIRNSSVVIKTIENNIVFFNETLENLNTSICPLSDLLVCSTDKTKVKEEILDSIESNKEGLEIQLAECDELKKELEAIELSIADYRKQEEKYNKKIVLTTQYEKLKKEVPVLPEKPSSVEEEDVEDEKRRLNAEKNVYTEYENFLKNTEVVNEISKRLSVFEELCEIFKPKGRVIESILANYVSVFETACNTRAKSLRDGFEISFNSENGISYLVKTSDTSEFQTYDSLSSGEKTFAMFLILDLLSTLTLSRIMILDDLDKLDTNAFSELFELIQSSDVQDSYDHIIVCAVNHEDTLDVIKKHHVDMIY